MALYHHQKVVKEFTYQDVHVVIVNAIRGAKCCEKDCHPREKTCPNCGETLKHLNVTLVIHEDKIILHLKRVTPLAAARRAEEMIDELLRRNNPDANKDQPSPLPPKNDRPNRPKEPKPNNEKKLIVPPLPPGFDLELFPKNEKGDEAVLAELIESIKKLGWGEKARQILINRKNSDESDPAA